MRTFIAIPLPPAVRLMLGNLQSELRSSGADVRWTAIDSIHLTLKFLGEIDPSGLPALAAALRNSAAAERSFSLCIRGLGSFPNLRNPRVIWCGIEGDRPNLEALQMKVEGACVLAGFAPEDRPFQPHLTLGRVRSRANMQGLLECLRTGSTLESTFAVEEFHIYKSTLRPQGAIYSVLESVQLQNP